MMIVITAAALAAGQPATSPAPMPMQMPAGHEMSMTHEQHAAMKEKCCCEHMGEKGHDTHAPKAEPHGEHGE
jgi:hypothetical protein